MTTGDSINVLGICGSLRQGSYNRATLRAAQELAPPGMSVHVFDLSPIPLYNEDVHMQGFPPCIDQFRARIAAADAMLIVTPEYNYSIPGVLKNAIDWASRPPGQPFDNKPIALVGASASPLGTARAQYHLRQVLVYLNGLVMNRPEAMIGHAQNKFDEQGRLTDEPTRVHIRRLLEGLAEWTRRMRR